VHGIGQLVGVVAVGRLVDEDVYGGEQGAMTRKPNSLVRPESAIVEMGNFRQGVEASAMGVAGEVAELLEFAKYREISFCAEGELQLGQIGDLVAAKVLAKHGGIEGGGAHNVRVHTSNRAIVGTIT